MTHLRDVGRGPDGRALHGWLAGAEHFEQLVPELTARSLRAVVPDLLGYGRSDALAEPSHLDAATAALATAPRAADCVGPILVGASLGAWRAASLVARGLPVRALVSLAGTVALLEEVLARAGDADAAAPVAWAQTLAATAPLGSLDIVPGAGHLLALEDAAGTADAIARLGALAS